MDLGVPGTHQLDCRMLPRERLIHQTPAGRTIGDNLRLTIQRRAAPILDGSPVGAENPVHAL